MGLTDERMFAIVLVTSSASPTSLVIRSTVGVRRVATAVGDTRFEPTFEPTFGVLGRLVGAVDALVAIDPAELSDVALADSLVELRREMDRQEAAFARLAHAAHTRESARPMVRCRQRRGSVTAPE